MHKKTILFVLVLALVVGSFAYFSGQKSSTLKPAISSSLDIAGLKDAVETQTVNLKNGDTYELTAGYVAKEINGKKIKMLAYNGSIPGPVIRVQQGDTVTIRFKNNTDMETLLHSHGVRMDNQYDGTQLTQKNILPGESFDYVLKFPDAGMMWYHPHVREDKQQPMGLFGSFIVTPNTPGYWEKVDHEEVLFLSDILMENGNIAPYSDTYITHALMGRFGNTLMINDKTDFTMTAKPGEVIRLYLANAATVRPFNFSIPGAKMKLVGGDNGRYERETFVDSVLISPSERAIVDVLFPKVGDYPMEHAYPGKTYRLGTVKVTGTSLGTNATAFETLRADTSLIKEFDLIRKKYLTKEPDKTINLKVKIDMSAMMNTMMGSGGGMPDMSMMGGDGHGASTSSSTGMVGMNMSTATPIEWEDDMGAMNVYAIAGDSKKANTTWIIEDAATKKQDMDIVWKFKKDVPVKIRIFNDPKSAHPMQHPIHFHGNKFVVLSRDGVAESNMVWKDTTLVRAGETVDILLETTNPGRWLAHCHIAEHMHAGMMIEYDVE